MYVCSLNLKKRKKKVLKKKSHLKEHVLNHVLITPIEFSKYSSCVSKLIIAKHFP